MATLITAYDLDGTTAGTTEPTLVIGYTATAQSRNVVHDLLDGGIAVSLVGVRPRAGTFELFYDTRANDAALGYVLHIPAGRRFLISTDRSAVNMNYVVTGQLGHRLESTRDHWVVSVGYQEIYP